jgi:hypothetical protein
LRLEVVDFFWVGELVVGLPLTRAARGGAGSGLALGLSAVLCGLEGEFLEVDGEQLRLGVGEAFDGVGRPTELLVAREAEGEGAGGNGGLLGSGVP